MHSSPSISRATWDEAASDSGNPYPFDNDDNENSCWPAWTVYTRTRHQHALSSFDDSYRSSHPAARRTATSTTRTGTCSGDDRNGFCEGPRKAGDDVGPPRREAISRRQALGLPTGRPVAAAEWSFPALFPLDRLPPWSRHAAPLWLMLPTMGSCHLRWPLAQPLLPSRLDLLLGLLCRLRPCINVSTT